MEAHRDYSQNLLNFFIKPRARLQMFKRRVRPLHSAKQSHSDVILEQGEIE